MLGDKRKTALLYEHFSTDKHFSFLLHPFHH